MTALGTGAALAGAATLSLIAVGVGALTDWQRGGFQRALLLGNACGGVGGMLVDSLLGATLQRVNYYPACGGETEREVYACGTATRHRRGLQWMDNDTVNLLSILSGAMLAGGIVRLLVSSDCAKHERRRC